MENGIKGNFLSICEELSRCTDTHTHAWHMHVPIAHIYILPPPPGKSPVLNPDHAKTSRSQLWILSLYLTHYNYSCHHKPHAHLSMVNFDSLASTNNAMLPCIITFVFLSNRLPSEWTTDSRTLFRWRLPSVSTKPGYCDLHYYT